MADLGLLAEVPLFAGLSPEDLGELGGIMRERVFDAGEVVCRAGEPSDRLWVITRGLIHILSGSSVVARGRKGDVIGEIGVIGHSVRSATVVARVRTSALELDGAAF